MEERDSEKLLARLVFKNKNGKDLGYVYSRGGLKLTASVDLHPEDNSQFFNVGKEIRLNNAVYKIVEVVAKLDEFMNDMEHDYGYNAGSATEPTNFNLSVFITVEES